MKETLRKLARGSLLLTLPIYAAACETGDKPNPTPDQKPSVSSQDNTLTPYRKELLDIARSTNGGVVFLNINDYDQNGDIFIQVTQLNPQTQETIVKGRTEIKDKDKTGKTIEAGIIIDNCSNAFILEISTDGENFDPLTYTNPDTGIKSATLQLDQKLCYSIMPFSVNN